MIKRLLIFLLILLFASTGFAAAPDNFFATSLTGGTTGCLDAIDVTNDAIDDSDAGYVKTSAAVYLYHFNSTSGAAESSPDVIKPDNDGGAAYAGDGRWILIGIYVATAQLANGGQINEFSTDGTMAGNSDSAVPTEKAVVTYVPTIVASKQPGELIRTTVAYSDTDTVTLTPAVYHHQGTVEQMVEWDSALTFDFGSGGSNASSDDLGANEFHYIYIDDSALSGSTITAARLLNDTTAPAWSDSKHGYYNSNDRCIFAVLTNASSQVIEFYQVGNAVFYADHLAGGQTAVTDYDYTGIDVDTTWDDVYLPIPGFSTKAQISAISQISGATTVTGYWRKNGQTGTTGHLILRGYNSVGEMQVNSTVVVSDATQIIEVKYDVSDGSTITVYVDGYYLPNGM